MLFHEPIEHRRVRFARYVRRRQASHGPAIALGVPSTALRILSPFSLTTLAPARSCRPGHAQRHAFAVLSIVCLLIHHVVVRAMAHDHVAHVLLSSGAGTPPPRAAALALGLVIGRFVSVMLVPGLLLAATAELAAYLLVGPVRAEEHDDDLIEDPRDEI